MIAYLPSKMMFILIYTITWNLRFAVNKLAGYLHLDRLKIAELRSFFRLVDARREIFSGELRARVKLGNFFGASFR